MPTDTPPTSQTLTASSPNLNSVDGLHALHFETPLSIASVTSSVVSDPPTMGSGTVSSNAPIKTISGSLMPTENFGMRTIPKITRNGLHVLHEIFRLAYHSTTPPNLSDVVLIAIDFENINTIKSGFAKKDGCQAGLAILDTREIHQVSSDKLLSTYNFATGSPSYLGKASRKFMFGETIAISTSDIAGRIQSLIPPERNVVFVGHGVSQDLQALRALDVQFPVCLSAVLDTLQVANQAYGFWGGTLSDLLLKLDCPFNRLHSAGNDANFTLRALLLLAVHGFAGQQRDHDEGCNTLAILQQVSTSPIPHWIDPEVEAMIRRDKSGKSWKEKSKTWDMEMQDRIRAVRKLKREGVTDIC